MRGRIDAAGQTAHHAHALARKVHRELLGHGECIHRSSPRADDRHRWPLERARLPAYPKHRGRIDNRCKRGRIRRVGHRDRVNSKLRASLERGACSGAELCRNQPARPRVAFGARIGAMLLQNSGSGLTLAELLADESPPPGRQARQRNQVAWGGHQHLTSRRCDAHSRRQFAAARCGPDPCTIVLRWPMCLSQLPCMGRIRVAIVDLVDPMTWSISAALFCALLFPTAPLLADGRAEAQAQVNFGIEVARRGLWREAIYRWERAVQIDPAYAEAYNDLGVAYEHEGQLEKARKAYEKAIELDPKNPQIRQNYDLFKEINDRASAANKEKP